MIGLDNKRAQYRLDELMHQVAGALAAKYPDAKLMERTWSTRLPDIGCRVLVYMDDSDRWIAQMHASDSEPCPWDEEAVYFRSDCDAALTVASRIVIFIERHRLGRTLEDHEIVLALLGQPKTQEVAA